MPPILQPPLTPAEWNLGVRRAAPLAPRDVLAAGMPSCRAAPNEPPKPSPRPFVTHAFARADSTQGVEGSPRSRARPTGQPEAGPLPGSAGVFVTSTAQRYRSGQQQQGGLARVPSLFGPVDV